MYKVLFIFVAPNNWQPMFKVFPHHHKIAFVLILDTDDVGDVVFTNFNY